ncbi:MAG: hypothetical protein BGP00_06580 [Novosphingobium sp. 63-713]|nr:MAG: hypothetical protein BGP00_06580 [Novosphingobium sp. 63-713]
MSRLSLYRLQRRTGLIRQRPGRDFHCINRLSAGASFLGNYFITITRHREKNMVLPIKFGRTDRGSRFKA